MDHEVEHHDAVIDRLLSKFNLYQGELVFSDHCQFNSQNWDRDIVDEAIDRQRQTVAFVDATRAIHQGATQ